MSQPDHLDPGMLYPGMLEDYCVDPDGVWWPIPGPAALSTVRSRPEQFLGPAHEPDDAGRAQPNAEGSDSPPGLWLG